jgi:acetyl esterase
MSDLDDLHPVLAAGVAKRRQGPRYSDLSLVAARQMSLTRQGEATRLPAVESVADFAIPGPDGALPVRLYRPSREPDLPLLVYFHGGGFVFGDLDSHDSILRRLTLVGRVVILSIGYRLAPDHPFPAATEDGTAALRYALAHAAALGAAPGAVFAGGDSAGAAIALTSAATVGGLAGLLLFYPVADLSHLGETESYRTFGDGRAGLSLDDMEWSARLYAPNPASRDDWRCSPLLLDDAIRVPPTFVATAEFDVLRSEGEALTERLAARGTLVEHHAAQGVNHGYLGAGEAVPQSGDTLTAAARWLNALVPVA